MDQIVNGLERPFTVADVIKGQADSRGKPIDDVFYKRDTYAIYQSGNEMAIQFSDDENRAGEQVKAVSALIPLRNRLQFLCSNFRQSDCYRLQIAEALHLGLEGQIDSGKRALLISMKDCLDFRRSLGRRYYLSFAVPAAFVTAGLCAFIAQRWGFDSTHGLMLLATAGGALGALSSIAIAIRGRTVALDGDALTNKLDGALRILIGAISAGTLFLLLVSGLLNLQVGSLALTGGTMKWEVALLAGIAAGFLERLVPDLLEGTEPKATDQVEAEDADKSSTGKQESDNS